MRKEYDVIGDAAYGCLCALIIGGMVVGGCTWFIVNAVKYHKAEKAKVKKTEQYNALTVQKHNARFNKALKAGICDSKMHVFGHSSDTIRIKFSDARFQRQFEKQWRKYSNHKLNHINQNIEHR